MNTIDIARKHETDFKRKMGLINYKIHPIHHLLHAIWSLIVFSAGIGADIGIVEYRHSQPHTVRWASGEVETNYHIKRLPLPEMNVICELGMTDDGIVVWRIKK